MAFFIESILIDKKHTTYNDILPHRKIEMENSRKYMQELMKAIEI